MRAITDMSGRAPAPRPPAVAARGPILLGLATILVAFGGFGSWAALAPLKSAALAPGEVVASSHSKTIQHLEGGIVEDILVKDGSRVEAGEVLVRLDDTRARASLALLRGRYHEALAREARLIAERDGRERIAFPERLTERRDDPDVAEILRGQRNVFDARRRSLAGKSAILEQRIARYREEIAALDAQQQAQAAQLALIREELAGVRELFEKGLERKPRLLALQREASRIEGTRAALLGRIAQVKQSIAGTELEIADLRTARIDDVTGELKETQAEIHDLEERLLAARNTLRRTVIRAPQDGIVVNLRIHTQGGVIGPGEAIMDLTPEGDRLIVAARLRPEDIDVVEPGQEAQIRLTAFKQRVTPSVDGRVLMVSADRLTDEATGEEYYLARIALDPASLEALPDAGLYPGMPAEAVIVTGERTALDYLLAPITRSMGRAMLEQ